MLNQFSQFVSIRTRNVGATASGCRVDGLISMIDVSFALFGSLFHLADGAIPLEGCRLTAGGKPTGWLQRLHQKRHWYAQLSCLQLQHG